MTRSQERTRPQLTVDLAAVADNTRHLAAVAGGRLMAVVKAGGFGHGDAAIATTALDNGASSLGVASLQEALTLRDQGVNAPILSWLNPVDGPFADAVRADVQIAVPTLQHLAAVVSAAERARRRATVHLHADVGMSRDGAAPGDWAELCRRARAAEQRGAVDVVGVMGHLGWSDDPHDTLNATGCKNFDDAAATARDMGLRPSVRHLAATAATLTIPASRYDLCRVGAGLVGIDPSGSTRLHPAMTLTAPVVSVREVPPGAHVGYGRTYATSHRTQLALLPVGYADGVPRAASGHGWVSLRGRRCRVVGLISMDQLVVDVGRRAVAAGDVATIFGPGDHGEPTAAEWARWAGTIEHEIVTGIGPRVVRRVVGTSVAAAHAMSA